MVLLPTDCHIFSAIWSAAAGSGFLVNVAGRRQAWRLVVGFLLGIAILAFFLIHPLSSAVLGKGP